MIAELGHFALVLVAVTALIFPWIVLYGSFKQRPNFVSLWRPAVITFFSGLTLCLLSLIYSFLADDFSVAYVAANSNSSLEYFYKISAVWSGHEGSLLIWIWFISCWSVLFTTLINEAESLKATHSSIVLTVIGLLAIFLIFTSNPFSRLLPTFPIEGTDLNPILQDVGMIFHPPLLFISYAGMTTSFAYSLVCLLRGKIDEEQLRSLSKVSQISWGFLTAGNVLGSWWAYSELGWGGWWFWDPVENASFIPWLLLTAQLHGLLLVRQRQKFTPVVLVLPIISFFAILLGTFIVRSGLMQSVHAFASDPGKGVFLLAITFSLIFPAIGIYFSRLSKFRSCSTEMSLFDVDISLAVFILSVTAFIVLFGTVFPLGYQLLGFGSLSVGAPYFNSIFAPFTVAAALIIGFGALQNMKLTVKFVVGALALVPAVWIYFRARSASLMTVLAAFSAGWLIAAVLVGLSQRKSRRSIFASIAHLGLAVSMMGVIGDTQFSEEAFVRMGPGSAKELGGMTFVCEKLHQISHKSYTGVQADFLILDHRGHEIGRMEPQRRVFRRNAMEMTEAAIKHNVSGDIYISLGNRISPNEYLLKLAIKPFVWFIWLGGIFMILSLVASPVLRKRGTKK